MTRVLFVSDSFTFALEVYKGMFDFKSIMYTDFILFWQTNMKEIITTIIGLGICLFAPNTSEICEKFKPTVPYLIYAVTLIVICLVTMDKVVNFLYFQF